MKVARLVALALYCIAATAAAQFVQPQPAPPQVPDFRQGAKEPDARPDASALKPEAVPLTVEGDAVKLPDKQFEIPPEARLPEAPPPDEPPPPGKQPKKSPKRHQKKH